MCIKNVLSQIMYCGSRVAEILIGSGFNRGHWIRTQIRIGSGFNRVSGSGSVSNEYPYGSATLCRPWMKLVIPVGWENAPSTLCILDGSAKKRRKNLYHEEKIYIFSPKFSPDLYQPFFGLFSGIWRHETLGQLKELKEFYYMMPLQNNKNRWTMTKFLKKI
jgi:hypothetical protein